MGDDTMKHEYTDSVQRLAVCNALGRKKYELFQSYNDYPQAVRNNAKRGIELNEKNGNKCATQVGKIRATQLRDGERVTVDTMNRM